MWLDHFLLWIGWIVYCTLHSVLAGSGTKRFFKEKMKSGYKFYRPVYVVFSFLGLVALLWWLMVLKSPRAFKPISIIIITGWVVTITGFVLMAICIWRYFLTLSGLKSLMNESNSNELIISGINKYLRHPLYLGTFAFIWGLWLVYPAISFLLSNAIITTYTLIGINLEEKKLIAEFGDKYESYRQTVPRLWPRLHKKPIQIE